MKESSCPVGCISEAKKHTFCRIGHGCKNPYRTGRNHVFVRTWVQVFRTIITRSYIMGLSFEIRQLVHDVPKTRKPAAKRAFGARLLFYYTRRTALVGVSRFELEASWSRTKRDTKLRHTPEMIQLRTTKTHTYQRFARLRLPALMFASPDSCLVASPNPNQARPITKALYCI